MTATKADLDAATDKLNRALAAGETILLRYAKGAVAAEINLTDGTLGVRRIGTEWQLVWTAMSSFGVEHTQPLADSPRRIRIEAAYKLDDLRRAILAQIDAELQAVSVAAEAAWNFYEAYEFPSRGEPSP